VSRGLGSIEKLLLFHIYETSKPMTFTDIMESMLASVGHNGTFKMWRDDNASRM
jgi:hypothetical protein